MELLIFHDKKVFSPTVLEGIVWQTERKNAPGSLSFKVLEDDVLKLSEGDAVRFCCGGEKVFYGFVFTVVRGSDGVISVTAYDQLRYLKNKDTYVYENKTAADVVKMIAKDFGLETGVIDDTKYRIPSRVESNSTLFDIIGNALDLTLVNRSETFVLFDDFGKLSLRDLKNMRVNIIVDSETGESFEFRSSIDSDTFNRVKLIYDDSKAGKREVYIAQDDPNIRRWGVLQYCGNLKKGENGAAKAQTLLKLYNEKSRSLDVKNVLGDCRVRAGSMVAVMLKLGEEKISNFMLVEKCRHEFRGDIHLMDLSLRG